MAETPPPNTTKLPPDTSGRAQRAQMDIEVFKGLLLVNGGGAIALLSFLAAILNKSGGTNPELIHAVLGGVLLMMGGLAAAVGQFYLRRRCSLAHEERCAKGQAGGMGAA